MQFFCVFLLFERLDGVTVIKGDIGQLVSQRLKIVVTGSVLHYATLETLVVELPQSLRDAEPSSTFHSDRGNSRNKVVCRLRVLSNFGDGGCGASEIGARALNFEETRGEGSAEFSALLLAGGDLRARACICSLSRRYDSHQTY